MIIVYNIIMGNYYRYMDVMEKQQRNCTRISLNNMILYTLHTRHLSTLKNTVPGGVHSKYSDGHCIVYIFT